MMTRCTLIDFSDASIWRNVPDAPGYRAFASGRIASAFGRGRSAPGDGWNWLKPMPRKDRQGHHYVFLKTARGRAKVHVAVVVLRSFVGEAPIGFEACHDDGDPANNALSNLRWDTHAENMRDIARHGRSNRGMKHPMRKITESVAREILSLKDSGVSASDLGERFGIHRESVRKIWNGIRWAHRTLKGC
jgi:hypothetical protein